MEETHHYVYLVECADGTYYAGWTTNLAQRIRAHNEGKGAKYTRGRLPVRLCYAESFPTKSEALKRELALKKLPREKKQGLIVTFLLGADASTATPNVGQLVVD